MLYLFSFFFLIFPFLFFFHFLLSLMNSSITKVCTNTYSPNFFYHFGPTRVDKWHMQQVPLSLSLRDTFSILFHSNEFFLLVKMCQYSKPESTCPCATSICTCDLGGPRGRLRPFSEGGGICMFGGSLGCRKPRGSAKVMRQSAS